MDSKVEHTRVLNDYSPQCCKWLKTKLEVYGDQYYSNVGFSSSAHTSKTMAHNNIVPAGQHK